MGASIITQLLRPEGVIVGQATDAEGQGRMAQELDSGLLVYRAPGDPEILLMRAGGPFWSKKKDAGTWSIPKNGAGSGDPLASARDQFTQDTGLVVEGDFIALTPIEQKGGRLLWAYAVACDLDLTNFRSHDFTLEWPPGSGRMEHFPEIERIQYFDLRTALRKLLPPQWPLLLEAAETLAWPLRRKQAAI